MPAYHPGRCFSRIILDPSKQALTRQESPIGLSIYADLNKLALQCLQPGGILVSCSCTGLVSEEDFMMALRAAAAEAGTDLQILALTGAAPDHPHAVHTPEGRYLKVAFARSRPFLGP